MTRRLEGDIGKWGGAGSVTAEGRHEGRRSMGLLHMTYSSTPVGKCKIVPVLSQSSTIQWRYVGQWRYSSTILDLSTRWRWVVSFTLLQLYPRGKSTRYPFDRRVGGPQSRPGRCGEEKNLALPGIERGQQYACRGENCFSLYDISLSVHHVGNYLRKNV
jgi:hypothetical protein